MSELLDSVREFLEKEGWPVLIVPDRPIAITRFEGENGTIEVQLYIVDEQSLVCYSVSPANVPAEKRQAIAEFTARANYGLILGNLELDMDSGQVRFKTSLQKMSGEITADLLGPLLYSNVLMMDRYLPGLLSVTYGNSTPAEAVARADAQPAPAVSLSSSGE